MIAIFHLFWNPLEARPRALVRTLIHFLLTLVVLIVVLIPLEVVNQVFWQASQEDAGYLLAGASLQSVVIVIACFVCCLWPDRRRFAALGFEDFRASDLLFGLILGAALMLLIFGVEYAGGRIQIERFGRSTDANLMSWSATQVSWLGLMVLVGISEEILSRGYHLKNLAEGTRFLGAVPSLIIACLLSSIVFGILHGLNPHATMVSNISVILAGIFLATLRVATGSLAAPIGAHITWNYFQGPLLGFPVSGNSVPGAFMEIQHTGPTWLTGGEFGPEASILGWGACCTGIAVTILRASLKSRSRHRLQGSVVALIRYDRRRRGRSPFKEGAPPDLPGASDASMEA